jgi:AcrR family transcriptional regulator
MSVESGIGTRGAILAHAVELASVSGLEGLTIGHLAAELGLSKSGLFRHFGSKEELQLATIERATELFRREVLEPASGAPLGLERLRALLESYLSYLERDVLPGGCFISAASAEFDGRPGRVRDAIAATSEAWARELEGEAQVAYAQGELPEDADPAQLVFELSAFATRANATYQLYGDRGAFDRARTAIARSLGVKKAGPRRRSRPGS